MSTRIVCVPAGLKCKCKACNHAFRTTGEERVLSRASGGGRLFWSLPCPNCGQSIGMSSEREAGRSDGSDSIHCFVATCCFGELDAPEVIRLRRFRNETLSASAAGRRFIAWYYSGIGERAARFIRDKAVLRRMARTMLALFIRLAVK